MSSKILHRKTKSAIRKWIKVMKKKKYPKGKITGERAKEKLSLSYQVLGMGNYRIVYDLENGYVLKVATTKEGISSNWTEVKIYKISPKSIRKHLAKVKKSGSGWVIMKKAEALPREESNIQEIYHLEKKFKNAGIIAKDIFGKTKPNWNNLGKIKDNIVVVDYGKFKKRK